MECSVATGQNVNESLQTLARYLFIFDTCVTQDLLNLSVLTNCAIQQDTE